MRRLSALLLVVVGLSLVAVPAIAGQPEDLICPGLDSGKIDTVGDPETVTVTAPDGYLIDSYCVKAGPGYLIIEVDPPQATVTIDHPLKDSVSHYSLSYLAVTTTTEGTTSTTQTTTTTTSTLPSSTTTTAEVTTSSTITSSSTTSPITNDSSSTLPAPTTSATSVSLTDPGGVTSEILPFTGPEDVWPLGFMGLGALALGGLILMAVRGRAQVDTD